MPRNNFQISFRVESTSKDPKLVLKRYQDAFADHWPEIGANYKHDPLLIKAMPASSANPTTTAKGKTAARSRAKTKGVGTATAA